MNITLIQLVPVAVFAVVMFIVWAVYNAFSTKTSRATERLEEIRDGESVKNDLPVMINREWVICLKKQHLSSRKH